MGRVVYDRPIHFWTKNDLARVARNTQFDDETSDNLIEFISNLTVIMLEKILDRVGLGQFAEWVNRFLVRLVEKIIDFMAASNVAISDELREKMKTWTPGGP